MCVCWVGTDLFRTSCRRSHDVQWLISKHCELIPGRIGRTGQGCSISTKGAEGCRLSPLHVPQIYTGAEMGLTIGGVSVATIQPKPGRNCFVSSRGSSSF